MATATSSKTPQSSILKKQDILLLPINNFFRNPENAQMLEDLLVRNEYKVSLRVIDWFVTNYSKKYNIVIEKESSSLPVASSSSSKTHRYDNRTFLVYIEYKSQLKAYSKKQFDPFCRRSRIQYEYASGKSLETTIGQLNFFRWAIENRVIQYIIDNYDDIEKDMNNTHKNARSPHSSLKSMASTSSGGISLSEVSSDLDEGRIISPKKKATITATKSICKHNVKIIVSFD